MRIGKRFLVLVSLLLLLSPAFGRTLELELVFSRANSSVSIANAQVMESSLAQPSSEAPGDFNYSIETVDSSGRGLSSTIKSISFFMLTDPPQELDSVPAIVDLSYSGGVERMVRVTEIDTGKVVMLQDINLCNKDNFCSGWENSLSCPEDCSAKSADGLCDPDAPGCDPDCEKGVDKDCKYVVVLPVKMSPTSPAIFVIVGVLAAVAYAGYVMFWKKKPL